MVSLRCAECGHEADFFDFCRTPVNGELPAGTHQCPSCRFAWRMEEVEPGRRTSFGLFIPPRRKAVRVPSIL